MQIEPADAAFAQTYAAGHAQVVWTPLVADLETPVSAFLKLASRRPLSFLLESVEGGAARGRYSIIGLEPDLVWRAHGKTAEINRTARARPDAFAPCGEPPLDALRGFIAESRIDLPAGLPPMAAGIFGYLGYDMVRLIEQLADAQSRPARPARRHPGAADRDGHLRRREGRDHRRHAGAAGDIGLGEDRATRARPSGSARWSTTSTAPLDKEQQNGADGPLHVEPRSNTTPAEFTPHGRARPRSTSRPATSSRWCCRSASSRRSRCPPSRSTARCAASIPRRSCSTSTSAASRWSARAPRSWCACATAR